jgi:O-antigen/teichoic acid export membrane protein
MRAIEPVPPSRPGQPPGLTIVVKRLSRWPFTSGSCSFGPGRQPRPTRSPGSVLARHLANAMTDPDPNTVAELTEIGDIGDPGGPGMTTRRERASAKAGGSLRKHAAHGVMLNAVFAVGLQGLAFLRGLLVAIFVSPADYGVWGLIVVGYTALAQLKQVGVGDKYIQQDDPDEEVAFQKAFTLEAIITGSFWVLLMVATPVLALVYRAPQIVAPGLVTLLAIPGAILQTPIWAYARDLDFRKTRILASVDPLIGIVVTIAAAVAGLGYWSFALGSVAGAWSGATVILRYAPYRLRFRYDRGTAREYVHFSAPILMSNLGNSILLQGVTLAARSAVGLTGIGAMSLANSVRVYTEFADGIISGTMYPMVCAIKDRRDLLYESFVKSNRLAMMWGIPIGIGVALFAHDLLIYVLGRHWTFATVLFQSVGIVSAIGHIAFNWDDYVRALGDTKPIAKYAWIGLISWIAGPIPLMLIDGLRGYSIGLFLVAGVTLALRYHYVRRLFPGFSLLPHAALAVAPQIPAVLVVLGLRRLHLLPETLPVAVLELSLYVGITGLVTWLSQRALLLEAVGYLRRARSGEPIVPAPS